MSDYWDDDEAYDEAAAALKQTLRDAVTFEVKNTIELLQTQNRELKSKLVNLEQLEREAVQARAAAEREGQAARRDAEKVVRKEKLRELLAAIDERLYMVERVYTAREKCDRCDDKRRLTYTTPRGRDARESCECADQDCSWQPVEAVAHEVSRQDGKLRLWWKSSTVHSGSDSDYIDSPSVYKRAENASAETVAQRPSEFSFKDLAAAQAAADAANRNNEDQEKR